MYIISKKVALMQRTQIYFEENTLNELKQIAKSLNISVSEFIRRTIKKEIKKHKKETFNDFLNSLTPLESFKEIDASEYVKKLRNKSRLINE